MRMQRASQAGFAHVTPPLQVLFVFQVGAVARCCWRGRHVDHITCMTKTSFSVPPGAMKEWLGWHKYIIVEGKMHVFTHNCGVVPEDGDINQGQNRFGATPRRSRWHFAVWAANVYLLDAVLVGECKAPQRARLYKVFGHALVCTRNAPESTSPCAPRLQARSPLAILHTCGTKSPRSNHKRQSRCLQRMERARWHLCALSDAGSLLLMLTRIWTWPYRDTVRHRRSSLVRGGSQKRTFGSEAGVEPHDSCTGGVALLVEFIKAEARAHQTLERTSVVHDQLTQSAGPMRPASVCLGGAQIAKTPWILRLHERISATARVCTDAADLQWSLYTPAYCDSAALDSGQPQGRGSWAWRTGSDVECGAHACSRTNASRGSRQELSPRQKHVCGHVTCCVAVHA